MLKWNKILLLALSLSASAALMAQNASAKVEPKDFMRSNGKIYVVIAIVLTVLTGLILYVVHLDRKISKLEKEIR